MGELRMIAVSSIRENPDAIRNVDRSSEDYLGIVESMRGKGFRGTVTVRPMKDEDGNEYFAVVDGMHRFLAAKDLGLEEVPCDVTTLDDAEAIEYSIMANVHKVDTKPSEYRTGILRWLEMNPTKTVSDAAEAFRKSMSWIQNILRLNNITEDKIMSLVDSGEINLSNAYALAKLPPEEQVNFITEAQTQSPAEFCTRVAERVKEINEARRKGKTAGQREFTPAEHMQKMKDIKDQRDSGEIGKAIATREGIKDVDTYVKGFKMALNWCLHVDPFSLDEQKAAFEAKQKEKEEKAKEREAKRIERQKDKAEQRLQEAGIREDALASGADPEEAVVEWRKANGFTEDGKKAETEENAEAVSA